MRSREARTISGDPELDLFARLPQLMRCTGKKETPTGERQPCEAGGERQSAGRPFHERHRGQKRPSKRLHGPIPATVGQPAFNAPRINGKRPRRRGEDRKGGQGVEFSARGSAGKGFAKCAMDQYRRQFMTFCGMVVEIGDYYVLQLTFRHTGRYAVANHF